MVSIPGGKYCKDSTVGECRLGDSVYDGSSCFSCNQFDDWQSQDDNWDDTYWGVCDGVGFNNLGKILMAVRDVLREDAQ